MRNLQCGGLFLVLGSIFGLAGEEQPRTRPVSGGGIVDAAGKVGYWPAVDGGIDAVDLATGEVRWRSKAVDKPLLAAAGRVVGHSAVRSKASEIRVVILDAEGGKQLAQSPPVALPEWVNVGTAYGRSIHKAAQFENNKALVVWEARAWYAGGAAPPPQVERTARKEALGAVRVDLDTGVISKVEPVPASVPRPSSMAELGKVGEIVFNVAEQPGKMRFQQRRFVEAMNARGKVVWRHEIAGSVFLPPPP